MITKLDERGHKLEPFEDAIIEVPEEHMGQVPPFPLQQTLILLCQGFVHFVVPNFPFKRLASCPLVAQTDQTGMHLKGTCHSEGTASHKGG